MWKQQLKILKQWLQKPTEKTCPLCHTEMRNAFGASAEQTSALVYCKRCFYQFTSTLQ